MAVVATLATACSNPGLLPSATTPDSTGSTVAEALSPRGEPRITAEIPWTDGSLGGGLAVGAGSVWVGKLPEDRQEQSGSVVRIDLATNDIVAEIPVVESPGRKRIAATDDAVWVASLGSIERIDPTTNIVVATLEIPDRSTSAMAVDADALWAVTIDRSGQSALIRIDSANEIVAEIPLGPQIVGYEDEVLLGAGSVWVLGVRWFERGNAEYGSDLIRIDPSTNRIVARIPVNGFQMAMGADEVWVRFPDDGVFDAMYHGERGEEWRWTRVDAHTNEASEPFPFDDHGLRRVTAGALWSVGYDDQEHVRVTRFDPDTLEVEVRSEPIRSYYHDAVLDPASATVWVSATWKVVRFDIDQ